MQFEIKTVMALLKQVGRSFYLSVRVLPRGLRYPLGLAYLLARTADTIADTKLLPAHKRAYFLNAFLKGLRGDDDVWVQQILEQIQVAQQPVQEAGLLAMLPQTIALYRRLPDTERQNTADVLATLIGGMRADLRAFPPERSGQIAALPTAGALDDYTYAVAGCVGEYWTRMLIFHIPALANWEPRRMVELGVRYGKGLQLVNVLRDAPADIRMGRCYLPADEVENAGLTLVQLQHSDVNHLARPILLRWSGRAVQHFESAETYVLAIPRHCIRLRLASLWPQLLGLATLQELLRDSNWLHREIPVKVTRSSLYRLLGFSVLVVCSNVLLGIWLRRIRGRVLSLAIGKKVNSLSPRAVSRE